MPSPRKAQSETGGYIKYIRKPDNCLFIVLEQRFLNIKTASCSQIQDAAIIGLQYSKTSMLYARQLKSIIDIYSLSPFFHLLRMIFCIFSHEAMFQIFRSIRRKIYCIIFFHNNRAGTNFTAFLKTLWKNHGIAINVRPPVYHLFHQLLPEAIYCFDCCTLLLRSKIESIQIFYRDCLLSLQPSIKYYTFLLRPFIYLLPILNMTQRLPAGLFPSGADSRSHQSNTTPDCVERKLSFQHVQT